MPGAKTRRTSRGEAADQKTSVRSTERRRRLLAGACEGRIDVGSPPRVLHWKTYVNCDQGHTTAAVDSGRFLSEVTFATIGAIMAENRRKGVAKHQPFAKRLPWAGC